MPLTRKSFLQLIGLGVVAPIANKACSQQKQRDLLETYSPSMTLAPLKLGLASYTMREYSVDKTIETALKLGLKDIAYKSYHLAMDLSDDQIKEVAKKTRDAGLNLYGAGVIYMKSEAEVDNAFRYAKAADLEMIIGVPNHDLLPLVEEKVKETDIKVAIHNHGPGDDVYPTPDAVWEKIKDLDKRIGFCIDIGHVKRLGLDPNIDLEKYKDRLYDMHLKDVDKLGAKGRSVEMGHGIIDIFEILKTLKKIDYKGVMSLEYEKDGKDCIPGLSESVGYVRGLMRFI